MNIPEHIRIKDAQRVTGLSETSVRRLCDSQAFPTIRIGRSICIDKKGFAAWLNDKRREPARSRTA